MKKLNIGIFKVLSLAVGLAVGLVLIAKISFESSYDKFYPAYDDIYCVQYEYGYTDGKQSLDYYTPGAISYYLQQELPQVVYGTKASYTSSMGNIYTEDNRKLAAENGILAVDTNYFKVFPRPVLAGPDPSVVLGEWNGALISRSMAEKFGGIDQAMGQMFFIEEYPGVGIQIGGVFEDIPENASLRFDAAVSISAIDYIYSQWGLTGDNPDHADAPSTMNWTGNSMYMSRVQLYPGTDPASLQTAMNRIREKYIPEELFDRLGYSIDFVLKPLSSEHAASAETRRTNLILGIVAFALILAATMNYIMIVISSLVARARGIAVRRCYGAGSGNIMALVFKETLINLAVSLVLAFLLILAFRGAIESILTTSLGALFSPRSLWVLLLTVAVVLIVAAWIPGKAFQSIPIAVAFRNYADHKKLWKQVLLFLQLTLASLLITLLSLVALQYTRWVNADPGYDYDQLVGCYLSGVPSDTRYALMQAVESVPGVEAVGTVEDPIVTGGASGNNVYIPGENEPCLHIADLYEANGNWSELFGIDIIEGRKAASPMEVMVDPRFAEQICEVRGWKDGVIGKSIVVSDHDGSANNPYTIVGVFDHISISPAIYEDNRPVTLFYTDAPMTFMVIRVSELNPEVTGAIQAALDSVEPERFELLTYSSVVNDIYAPVRTIRESILAAGLVTVIIALLGLVGYTSDETGRRRKEVALRKINGAQSWEIIGIFISGIGKFSVVAVVLGCALSWFVFDMLLKSFELKVPVPLWLFAVTAVGLLAVLAAVVTARCLAIARTNPADSLRTE